MSLYKFVIKCGKAYNKDVGQKKAPSVLRWRPFSHLIDLRFNSGIFSWLGIGCYCKSFVLVL